MGKQRQRGRATALSLADALNVVEKIHRQGGGDKVPKSALEPILNSKPTSSLFLRKISALRAYGLATIHGEDIALTPLAKSYATPISPWQKKEVILQAFRKIPLFENLLNRYNGNPLPEINEFFYNLVADSYDIPHKEAPKWVSEFIKGAKLAGVIVSEAGRELVHLPIDEGVQISRPKEEPRFEEPGPADQSTKAEPKERGEALDLRILDGELELKIPAEINLQILKRTIGALKDALVVIGSRHNRLVKEKNENI